MLTAHFNVAFTNVESLVISGRLRHTGAIEESQQVNVSRRAEQIIHWNTSTA